MKKAIFNQLTMVLSESCRNESLLLLASLDEEMNRLKLRVGVDRAPSTLRTLKVVQKTFNSCEKPKMNLRRGSYPVYHAVLSHIHLI